MIELQNASRWYGQVIGINDISLNIEPGITALLGPNGSGKSTMIKLITGQLRPTTGSVRVDSLNPFANPKVYAQMGYCPEFEQGYEEMTGREFVYEMAAMTGLTGETLNKQVDWALNEVNIQAAANRAIGGYSKGMRQRIKIAQAIVHNPQTLILDEPLNGLDPLGRHDMCELFVRYATEGRCVLVSSHILHEVEQLTQNIVLLFRGRMMARGDVRQLRQLIDTHPHRIRIHSADPRNLASEIVKWPHVSDVQLDQAEAGWLEAHVNTPGEFYAMIQQLVIDGRVSVDEISSPDNNLEAVFNYLVKSI